MKTIRDGQGWDELASCNWGLSHLAVDLINHELQMLNSTPGSLPVLFLRLCGLGCCGLNCSSPSPKDNVGTLTYSILARDPMHR